jgi:DNA-binding MarR family transcriptional regulator
VLRSTFVYLVGRVDQGVRRELQRRLAPHEISLPELTALSVLHGQPDLSTAQIARRSLVSPQAMSYIISELERRSLVERQIDPSHRRILRTRLTAAGRGKWNTVNPIVEAFQAELLQDVSETEREVVLRGLTAAMKRLSRVETLPKVHASG